MAPRATRELAADAFAAALARHGRSAPHLCLIDERLDGDGIDLLHALGDVYVSLSHGEGWADAFEAAAVRTPVIGPGGRTARLPLVHGGRARCPAVLVPAPVWPPQCLAVLPSQRWRSLTSTPPPACCARTGAIPPRAGRRAGHP